MRVCSTFREAAKFAADYCRANKCTAQLLRQGSGWAVIPNDVAREPEPTYRSSYEDLDREREKELETRRRREEQDHTEWRARRDQLEKLRVELTAKRDKVMALARSGSLTYERLSLVIDNKNMYGFTEAELSELLEFQRQVRPGKVPSMCPSCHMVGSNCTCGRSWF